MALAPIKQDLILTQKTTQVSYYVFEDNGISVDITGWTVYFTVKERMSSPDSAAIISKTISTHPDGEKGIAEIALTSSDTNIEPGSYYYDIKFKDNETPANIIDVMTGRLLIERINTQRES